MWSLFAILLFFSWLLPTLAKSYSPSTMPNPMKDPAGCGRPNVKSSAICDPENILTKDNKDVIEGFINAVPTTTAQIAVVIIRSMDTKFVGSSSIEDATEKFARSLHDTWGVGNSDSQNGILMFISLDSRSIFISTGDGVKGKLSQGILEGYIINEVMKPELKYKYYSSAIEKGVFEIDNILSGKSNISAMYYNASSWMDSWFVKTGGFMGIFAVVFYWSWREGERMRKLERGRRALDELMTEITDGDTHFEARSCPICLELFTTSDEPETVDVPDVPPGAAVNPIPASSEKTGGHKNVLRPMKLQCGHLFCYGCLSEYLKTNDGKKCPICRAPVTGERPEPGPPPPGYGNTGSGSNSGSNSCAQGFVNEAGTVPSPSSSTNTNSYNPFSWNNNNGYRHRSRFTRLVGWEHRQAEYAYRVNRMNYLYPEVVNAETVFALNTALQNGSVNDFRRVAVARSTVVMRTITDLKTRAKAAKSGSKGSSMGSWGGGRSSGGGGGRW